MILKNHFEMKLDRRRSVANYKQNPLTIKHYRDHAL